jgi:hypothetical protein
MYITSLRIRKKWKKITMESVKNICKIGKISEERGSRELTVTFGVPSLSQDQHGDSHYTTHLLATSRKRDENKPLHVVPEGVRNRASGHRSGV